MQFRFTRMAALVVGLAVAATGCGKYSISNIRALKAFSDATKEYQKNNYKGAAADYERAIELGPDKSLLGFAYFFLGNSYDLQYKESHKGEADNDALLPKAVDNYRKAIDALQGVPDPREIRKLAFEYLIADYGPDRLNDLSQAEPIAQQLISLEPNEPANFVLLGSLYEKSGRLDDAEKYFKKAIEAKPKDPSPYKDLAGFYNRQGQFDKTMAAFQQGADVEPNNPEAWHTMATFYWDEAYHDKRISKATRQSYTEKGLADEEHALAINPDYADAWIYKNILLRMKALDEKDPAKQKALLEEADKAQAKGLDLQKKQPAPGATKGRGGN